MQESRLFKIVYYLLSQGAATAPELAQKLEVSKRTIYRDIDALSNAGIPIYTEPGRNGGIHLLDHFVLNSALISGPEKEKILSALQGMAIMNMDDERDTLEKLSALFHVDSVDWLEVDFSRWGDKPRDNRKFNELKAAVIHRKCMKITYAGSYATGSSRIIRPLKLSYKSKDWYLKAYCQKRQDFRLFKLNRILEWEMLEERFAPMIFPDVPDEPSEKGVTLSFPDSLAYRVYDEFDVNQITREEDGRLSVTANMPEDDWLVGYILSFGTQVEIVNPPRLKKAVAKRVKELNEKYCK